MNGQQDDRSLSMMNAAVSLVLLIPLLLLLAARHREFVDLGARFADKEKQYAELQSRGQISPGGERLDQPPVITISEAQVYSFASGRADLTAEFARFIADSLVPRLLDIARIYSCDVIEVIGHTDEQTVRSASNLDGILLDGFRNPSAQLSPGSNLDLGFLRAWAVVRALQADTRLVGKLYYAYSAGQTIMPDGQIAVPEKEPQPDASRRRIEVRLRRSR
jgi:hypothetical protein